MRYQGGKSKIAKPIAEVIHAVSGRQGLRLLAACGG